jgi:hypothetical protein
LPTIGTPSTVSSKQTSSITICHWCWKLQTHSTWILPQQQSSHLSWHWKSIFGTLTKSSQGPYNIIDAQQLPINGSVLMQQSPTSVEHINICQLLPFFECYNWGHECHTSVIMTL